MSVDFFSDKCMKNECFSTYNEWIGGETFMYVLKCSITSMISVGVYENGTMIWQNLCFTVHGFFKFKSSFIFG